MGCLQAFCHRAELQDKLGSFSFPFNGAILPIFEYIKYWRQDFIIMLDAADDIDMVEECQWMYNRIQRIVDLVGKYGFLEIFESKVLVKFGYDDFVFDLYNL